MGRMSQVTARLKEGVTIASAENELNVITSRLAAENPQRNRGGGVRIVPPARAGRLAPAIRRVLFLLFGAVGLVLALACVNVTNLSLARTLARQHDIAIRAALGAGRGRLSASSDRESRAVARRRRTRAHALAWIATDGVVERDRAVRSAGARSGSTGASSSFASCCVRPVAVAVGLVPALLATRTDTRAALEQAGGRGTVGRPQRWSPPRARRSPGSPSRSCSRPARAC